MLAQSRLSDILPCAVTKFKLSELRDQLDKRPRSLSVGSRFDEEVYRIMPPDVQLTLKLSTFS